MKIISVLSIDPEGGLLVKFQSKFHLGTVSKKCSGKKKCLKNIYFVCTGSMNESIKAGAKNHPNNASTLNNKGRGLFEIHTFFHYF